MGVRTSMGLESGGWGWGGCSHTHLCLTEVALQLAAITGCGGLYSVVDRPGIRGS